MGDAVTGINRADSASEKSNGPMLRQHHACCNSSHCCDRFRLPNGQVVSPSLSARLTACTAVAGQTAYPPPRESCVRGADRAAVDKLFRSAIYDAYALAVHAFERTFE
jgi:hypothetical protein